MSNDNVVVYTAPQASAHAPWCPLPTAAEAVAQQQLPPPKPSSVYCNVYVLQIIYHVQCQLGILLSSFHRGGSGVSERTCLFRREVYQ